MARYGGHRRDRLRALAQRVEIAEVRIMGSKSDLLGALVAGSSVERRRSAFIVLY